MSNEQIVKKIQDSGFSLTYLYEDLYYQNITLIKDFCKHYLKYAEMDDLLQEAYFGLCEAVEHYESSANIKFMTYAQYWIQKSLRDYCMKCCSLFKLPQYYNQLIHKYLKFYDDFKTEHDRKPTDKEIINELHIRSETLRIIKQVLKGCISSQTPLIEDDLTIEDTLQADIDIENDVCEDLYTEYEKEQLWQIVDEFTNEREARVIRYLFINGLTLQAAGEIEGGLTKERIRQIRESALKRLRQGKAKKKLLERLEVVDSSMYRGGLNSYKEHVNTSITERLGIENTDIKQGLTKAS